MQDCEHALALNGTHVKARLKLWTRRQWVFDSPTAARCQVQKAGPREIPGS